MSDWITFNEETFHWTIKLGFIKLKIKDKAKLKKRRLELEEKFNSIPIQNNKIVFSNYFGKSYGCNPKYITDEIIRQKLPYELVWIVKNAQEKKNEFPSEVKLVEYLSDESIKELASAKVWIDNTRKKHYWEQGLIKKKGQYYIQTWHGPLGMKKIEASIKDENPMWRKWAKVDSKHIDCLLASNKTDEDILKKCFWYKGEILRKGYPRNDIFFSSKEIKENIRKKVFDNLNISCDKELIVYLPTFRDKGRTTGYDIDILNATKALSEKFNKEYVTAVKLHPNTKQEVIEQFNFDNEKIIDAINYPDVQELMIASDVIITDYSSAIFDGMLEYKKGFIFVSDLELYKKERGFYFPLSDTPFPIAKNNNELIENIKNFDIEKYNNRISKYLKDKKYILDGNSSKRIVEKIKNIIN